MQKMTVDELSELFLSLSKSAQRGEISSFALTFVEKTSADKQVMAIRCGSADILDYNLHSDYILSGLSLLTYKFNKELWQHQLNEVFTEL